MLSEKFACESIVMWEPEPRFAPSGRKFDLGFSDQAAELFVGSRGLA